ncbi:MAG: (Fe-S)-binding protein [Raoultibacter sp.]
MGDQVFIDVLAESMVVLEGDAPTRRPLEERRASKHCASLFFPGCSALNFAAPLMQKVYDRLFTLGAVDGISLLCCGKILDFEPDAATVRPAFERRLVQSVAEHGVGRIVAMCPNCVETLREILAKDPTTQAVAVVGLPQVLVEEGLCIDPQALEQRWPHAAHVAVHDSCPDRKKGEFAAALRALFPAEVLVEMAHNRKNSLCCGSLARAAGNEHAADAAARKHGEEAHAAGAQVVVTSCMSCAYQLAQAQSDAAVCHYLELLFNEEIDWAHLPAFMKTRFLFEELHGARDYHGAAAACECGA